MQVKIETTLSKILKLVFNSEGEDNGPRDVPGKEMWKMRRKKKKGKI